MSDRLAITKTYKLFIGGKFPRTESGRSTAVHDAQQNLAAHVCHGSRKDLRASVEAAHAAGKKWAGATAYLRGQVLYRLAEMVESRKGEFAEAMGPGAEPEIDAAIDRVVHFAGWTDKFSQILGGANPVAGPYHNFTVPFPMGVVGVICPDEAPLLALLSLAAPALAAGNTVTVLASEKSPIPAMILAEAIATSDVPGGVVNILTGFREELVPHFASHREIIAIHAAGVSDPQRTTLREGAAENMKRVVVREIADWHDNDACQGPWWIEPFTEAKTIWHPSAT
ncbi:MAG: acyl-CoA reductase-like NAD-dependent aldehyde dehydrogenase [Phycisphaerales bacterium]|jgi:acyl-CoA reductase-like NAD-dependent aldehyde dehydrogenase